MIDLSGREQRGANGNWYRVGVPSREPRAIRSCEGCELSALMKKDQRFCNAACANRTQFGKDEVSYAGAHDRVEATKGKATAHPRVDCIERWRPSGHTTAVTQRSVSVPTPVGRTSTRWTRASTFPAALAATVAWTPTRRGTSLRRAHRGRRDGDLRPVPEHAASRTTRPGQVDPSEAGRAVRDRDIHHRQDPHRQALGAPGASAA